MKKNLFILSAIVLMSFTACTDWLTERQPGQQLFEDFFTSGEAAIRITTGVYTPLAWEYGTTFFPEWFIGDVMSDDAIKGGNNLFDMREVFEMENWRTTPYNNLLLNFYRANFQGIARANMALSQLPYVEPDEIMDERLRDRLMGEVYFLRAFYYFRLLRVFGGVPLVNFPILSDAQWRQPRASADDILDFIIQDLERAEPLLWHRSEMDLNDLGRVTRGAAQAMLARVNLWRVGAKPALAQESWEAARYWSRLVIDSGEYALHADYAVNFTLEGENGIESIFEIQFTEDGTSDWGVHAGGFGFSRGNFTMVLQRSRSGLVTAPGNTGWGFNQPSQNLFDAFEDGDIRRCITILDPMAPQFITPERPNGLITEMDVETEFGNRFLNRKSALYGPDLNQPWIGFYHLTHASRGPLNNNQIRFADVLLMYAEASMELGHDGPAIAALNQVRQRVNMPDFPGYNISINGVTITPDLRQAIRHERRVELAMEGHRWFDLVRWGVAKEVMDAYAATLCDEQRSFKRPFIAGVHELLPIPAAEIRLNPMPQNPGF